MIVCAISTVIMPENLLLIVLNTKHAVLVDFISALSVFTVQYQLDTGDILYFAEI